MRLEAMSRRAAPIAALVLFAGGVAWGGPDPLPIRRAGLWEDRLTVDGKAFGDGSRTCYGVETDARFRSIFGPSRPDCQVSISRGPGGAYLMSGVCRSAQRGVTISKASATGDLSSSYILHVDSVTTGAPNPSQNKRMVMDMASHYLGACPAGMVAGDVVASGVKFNMLKP